MQHDLSRRRFLAACGALPFLGTVFFAGCDGKTPETKSAGPPEEPVAPGPKPSVYYIDESGQVGFGTALPYSFALGVLACTNGSESRHEDAIVAIREEQQFRRRVFSTRGEDYYKERFAVSLVEYLLGAEDLEYHALFLPERVNRRGGPRSAHFARQERLYRDILEKRQPAERDRVVLAQRTTDPAAMAPTRKIVKSTGVSGVTVVQHKTSDLMQLCDYLTYAVRAGLRNGRMRQKQVAKSTRPHLAKLLTEHLGTSTLSDGSLEHGDRFSVTRVSQW